MPDAWALLCTLMADPGAARALVESLERMPATVRTFIASPAGLSDPHRIDYEHRELWRCLAREGEE